MGPFNRRGPRRRFGTAGVHRSRGRESVLAPGPHQGDRITSARHHPSVPDVLTFIESGAAGIEANMWIGISAPVKTPRAIVDRLQREIAAVLKEPDVRERYAALGIILSGNTSEQFSAQIRVHLAKRAGGG